MTLQSDVEELEDAGNELILADEEEVCLLSPSSSITSLQCAV